MNKSEVKIVKNFRAPKKAGVHFRLLSLTGVSKGTSFYLEGRRAVIGRGESVEISILDPKASRQHAELVKMGDTYVITDLKSQNGVIVNDLKIAQHKLTTGDKIIIGSTVFKFDRFEVEKKEIEIIDDPSGEDEEAEEGEPDAKKDNKKKTKQTHD